MTAHHRRAWLLAGLLIATGCAPAAPTAAPAQPSWSDRPTAPTDTLVQFSLVSTLAAADYEGGAPLSRVLAAGDFGIGTFSQLDGEMIVLDGQIFQALADGTVKEVDAAGATPFAAVTFFAEDGGAENFAAPSLEELDRRLDALLPHRNLPYAVRIDGMLTALKIRSVPAQRPPYQPLVEVVKHQATFEHANIRGTLVGLRCPGWIGTLNVPGYHWHFLSDDRRVGGHVLACQLVEGRMRYDQCDAVLIELPTTEQFDRFDPAQVDKQDIDEIERQRAGPQGEGIHR